MTSFFTMRDIADVLTMADRFAPVDVETVPLAESLGRILARDIPAERDLPGFARSTMDGYAVAAASTFGASEGTPAYLTIIGGVAMGEIPALTVGPGEAVRIATGGMMPAGADAVVMVEHTDHLDDGLVEVHNGVAPGQHMVAADEDFRHGAPALSAGREIRPPEMGLLAAFGRAEAPVFRRPRVGIVSTGDEVVPATETPVIGQVRDVNTHTLSGLVAEAGGLPVTYGIVRDDPGRLRRICGQAVAETDMVLVSGGSSVGVRDFTVAAIEAQAGSEILAHGVSISPGKPTILADVSGKPFWGLPGHVVSAMVVFAALVRPFLHRLAGRSGPERLAGIPARLTRNLASAQGRTDFVRVRLLESESGWLAEPLTGKSGLLRTMIQADGFVVIPRDREGFDRDAAVTVLPL